MGKKLRAIDLYSGVGGWSLGLRMAGIDVVASYELWPQAQTTNVHNNGHSSPVTDIRALSLTALPADIDVVVGSPPCTQFSFSNRGGSGDIDDGLIDVAKFLAIVDKLKPVYWAMENVPRLAAIMATELAKGGRLSLFRHLEPKIRVVDSYEWGVPQRRRRCIIGNFPFDLLDGYRDLATRQTLGDVIRSLNGPRVTDPVYGITLGRDEIIDHIPEAELSAEEERINRDMKTFHPVYNNMAFPDSLKRPSRTVTATCTRVSRESIVVESPNKKGRYRRLSVRERACVQSFPITYQFYGATYAQKLKMVGNAVPPLLTFYIANAMQNRSADEVPAPAAAILRFKAPSLEPPATAPDGIGESYPATRRFRAAIPNLRFKSGMRFELGNMFRGAHAIWNVRFFFGNSKNIEQFDLGTELLDSLTAIRGTSKFISATRREASEVKRLIESTSSSELQGAWTHRIDSHVRPFELADSIGACAERIASNEGLDRVAATVITSLLTQRGRPNGSDKVLRNASMVFAGLMVGSIANEWLSTQAFSGKAPLRQRRLTFACDPN